MLRRIAVAALAAMLAFGSAQAGNARETRKQAESSLRVTGSIVIATDGTVRSHEVDKQAPLSPELAAFIDHAIAQWRFVPVRVDGKPVNAKVPMSLRLVARKTDDGNFNVAIASTYFGSKDDLPATDQPGSAQLKPPMYPKAALMMGGKGTVYLIVQIGRDGKVMNVAAEQVNLRVAGTDNQMALLRKQFTDSAVSAARRWTFTIPTTGDEADKDSWRVRVPVTYLLTQEKEPSETAWDTYIPGPRNISIPWAQDELRTAGAPDALPDSGVYPLQQGAQLLTPPTT